MRTQRVRVSREGLVLVERVRNRPRKPFTRVFRSEILELFYLLGFASVQIVTRSLIGDWSGFIYASILWLVIFQMSAFARR